MHKIFTDHIDVEACSLHTVIFSVSAKFEEVGEGNMTDPENIANLPEKSTRTCRYDTNPHRTSFSVVLGISIFGSIILFTIAVITYFIIAYNIIQYRTKTVINSDKDTEESIKGSNHSSVNSTVSKEAQTLNCTDSSCMYENVDEVISREDDSSITVQMNSNSAYKTTGKVMSIHDHVMLNPNCAYESAGTAAAKIIRCAHETGGTVTSGDGGVMMNPNYAYETSNKVTSRDDNVHMFLNSAYETAHKVKSREAGVMMNANCAYETAHAGKVTSRDDELKIDPNPAYGTRMLTMS